MLGPLKLPEHHGFSDARVVAGGEVELEVAVDVEVAHVRALRRIEEQIKLAVVAAVEESLAHSRCSHDASRRGRVVTHRRNGVDSGVEQRIEIGVVGSDLRGFHVIGLHRRKSPTCGGATQRLSKCDELRCDVKTHESRLTGGHQQAHRRDGHVAALSRLAAVTANRADAARSQHVVHGRPNVGAQGKVHVARGE